MTVSSIDVLIYSYKGKLLKDVVRSVNNNASGNHNIRIVVNDQSPLSKYEYFNDVENVEYTHIFWDYPYGTGKYIQDLLNRSKSDYVCLISDTALLGKDWDKHLIDFIGDQNIVISGIGKCTVKHDGLFYIKAEYEPSTSFYVSNFINKYFMFGKANTFSDIEFPVFLKHLGQNEFLSMEFFDLGIDIISAPGYIANLLPNNSLDNLYTPFSIKHNYNQVVRLLKENKEFLELHGLDPESIFELPYQTNDVVYDCYNNEFDKIDGRKFVGKIHYIR